MLPIHATLMELVLRPAIITTLVSANLASQVRFLPDIYRCRRVNLRLTKMLSDHCFLKISEPETLQYMYLKRLCQGQLSLLQN